MNIKEVYDQYLLAIEGESSKSTIAWYRFRLKSLLEFVGNEKPVNELSIHDLRAWRHELINRKNRYANHPSIKTKEGGLSPYTIQGYVRAVKRFCRWMVLENILENDPADRLKKPSLPRHPRFGISDRDRHAMLAMAKDNLRDYAMLKFAADSGCREAGIASLKMEYVDLETLEATVTEKGLGGNQRSRKVFFLEDTAEAISDWYRVRNSKTDYVFTRKDGGPLTESGIYQIFKRLAHRANCKGKWSPHQWRHWRARKWIETGMNIGVVSQLLGHTDPNVTILYYGSFADEELKKLYRKHSTM